MNDAIKQNCISMGRKIKELTEVRKAVKDYRNDKAEPKDPDTLKALDEIITELTSELGKYIQLIKQLINKE